MRKEEFFEVLGDLDQGLVGGAATMRRQRIGWKALGVAAACLCLTVGIITAVQLIDSERPQVGGGVTLGGAWPEGVDPIIASIAVYPATEDVREVADAVCYQVDEAAALAMEGLGEHLPTWLPEGIFSHNATLYETTMKDGTKYCMLRAFYTRGEIVPSNAIDGNTGQPLPDKLHDVFTVFVMNYKPNTKKTIYQKEDMSQLLANGWDGETQAYSVFHFSCGDVFIGFTLEDDELTMEELLAVIESIQ